MFTLCYLEAPKINTIHIPTKDILGAVLAGGQHRRMGNTPKWQLPIAGKPMIAHILERFSAQVATVIVNGYHPDLAQWHYPVVGDLTLSGHKHHHAQGPLAGLFASLTYAETQGFAWVATCPCDTPRLPTDYVYQLAQAIHTSHRCAVISMHGRMQPVFGLWSTALIPQLRETLTNSDLRAIGFWVEQLGTLATAIEFNNDTVDPHAFMNINTPEEWQAVQALYTTT